MRDFTISNAASRLVVFTVVMGVFWASEVRSQEAESLAVPDFSAVDAVAAIKARGEVVVVSFPHQLSHFVRTNLAKGPMPRAGNAEHFVGIDVDLMAAFADFLGVSLVIRPVREPSYGALIPDLLAGRGDLIASSVSVTEERKKSVDFSDPYFTVHSLIVTAETSTIRSTEDLEGKLTVVVPGSSQVKRLERLGVPANKMIEVSFKQEGYSMVHEGNADYMLVDSFSAELVMAKTPGLKIAFRLPGEERYGFAVPRGSNLRNSLNEFLAEMKRSGQLAEIIRQHQ